MIGRKGVIGDAAERENGKISTSHDSIIAGGLCLGGYNNSWHTLFVWRGGLAASMAPKVSPLL